MAVNYFAFTIRRCNNRISDSCNRWRVIFTITSVLVIPELASQKLRPGGRDMYVGRERAGKVGWKISIYQASGLMHVKAQFTPLAPLASDTALFVK